VDVEASGRNLWIPLEAESQEMSREDVCSSMSQQSKRKMSLVAFISSVRSAFHLSFQMCSEPCVPELDDPALNPMA